MHVRTRPDKTQRFVELVTRLQEDVRAHEPDTLLFQVMRSQDDPCSFAFTEIFRDRAAQKEHAHRPYHVAMADEGWSCIEGDADIRSFDLVGDADMAGPARAGAAA